VRRGRGEKEGLLDQIYIYERCILPKHIVVIYNRYRLAASKTLNINVKKNLRQQTQIRAPENVINLVFLTPSPLSAGWHLISAI